MKHRVLFAAAVLVACGLPAGGQAQTIYYKCQAAGGGATSYSDTPCRRGESEVRVMRVIAGNVYTHA